MSEEEPEVTKSTECIYPGQIDDIPFIYWLENQKMYPLLGNVAFDLLCTPASTAPMERIFSTGGETTSRRHNWLTDSNLEREILLRQNKNYLQLV